MTLNESLSSLDHTHQRNFVDMPSHRASGKYHD